MSTTRIDISNLTEHKDAARQLIEFADKERVFLFDAPMGAGKTTFIKSICNYLGVLDTMSSPTYSIVNEYITSNGFKVYHFDLYRLKSVEELFDIGFEEYLYSGNYVFIEWPEFAKPFLDSNMNIIIKIENDNRYIYAQKIKNNQ
jgi:tRNA threonylcarbamoyladenosine biosynthesis protein TsaE